MNKSHRFILRFRRFLVERFLFAVSAGLLFVWFSGQVPGLEGTQAAAQWSAENHDKSNFPLTGRHRTVSCRDCHLNGVFEGTPTACEACHWERRQDDRYGLRLGIHCGDCHVPFAWKHVAPDKWNHKMAADFPLEGMHRTLDCVECHGEIGFIKAEVDCFGCHESDYRETQEPDHISAGFSTDCRLCHLNTSSWPGARFSHSIFLLKGLHKIARCSDCHGSGQYKGLPSECVFCHREDYDGAGDPDHKKLRFPTECEFCHGTDAITWEGVVYDHSAFPLNGRHRVIDCYDCHSGGHYKGLPSVCAFCHLEDYISADNPDHKQLGFHTDCEVCHGTDAVSWENVTMEHIMYWPLQGAHSRLECSRCHVSADYRDFSCLNCHAHDRIRMGNVHRDVLGYSFNSPACYACHPHGRR